MTNPNSRIAELIGMHLNGTISEPEGAELNEWIAVSEENRQLFERYNNEQYVCTELEKHYHFDVRAGWEKLVEKANLPFRVTRPVVKLRWMLSVAAAVLVLAVFTWIFITSKPSATKKIAPAENVAYKNDVQPGGDHATLRLADGRLIVLDSAGNGALAQQGGTQVVKTDDGSLKYDVRSKGSEVMYNTLSTPKGGKFQIVLADGSKVWLNSLSSIKYPTVFAGSERRVDITGEAFFEIVPLRLRSGQSKPFRVHYNMNGQEGIVEVVGTQFNLKAYADEDIVSTTLIEGKVKVSSEGKQPQTINPGQQAQLNKEGQIKITSDINTDEIIAWKEGYFHFENKTIEEILQTAARWYDIDVRYDYKPIEGYRVRIERSVPISKVLQYLEMAGGVHFGIDGKTVIVKQ